LRCTLVSHGVLARIAEMKKAVARWWMTASCRTFWCAASSGGGSPHGRNNPRETADGSAPGTNSTR
jgi:hypothetical protein